MREKKRGGEEEREEEIEEEAEEEDNKMVIEVSGSCFPLPWKRGLDFLVGYCVKPLFCFILFMLLSVVVVGQVPYYPDTFSSFRNHKNNVPSRKHD